MKTSHNHNSEITTVNGFKGVFRALSKYGKSALQKDNYSVLLCKCEDTLHLCQHCI